jgi:hypothetical protein
MVNPPLKGPSSLRNVPVSSLPGGLNLYDGEAAAGKLEPVYTVNPQLADLTNDIKAVTGRIDDAFHVNLFMAISNMEGIQPKNQMELNERRQESLLQLGPVLQHLHGELLDKVLDRLFDQCVKADILPPAPPELQGVPIKPRYISALAMAQRAVATTGIRTVAEFTGAVAAIVPDVTDKFDADQAVDEFANAIGVPPRVIRSDDDVAKRREARAAEMQKQQAMAAAQMAAQGVKDLSGPVDPTSLLKAGA